MSPELQDEIRLELAQLRTLLGTFRPLLLKVKAAPPDAIEVAALAGLLHSFYNGVENILKRIAVHSGQQLPTSISWHSELLESMAIPAAGRKAVLDGELLDRLRTYLGFRHVYRHSYTFQLRWEKMQPLITGIEDTFHRFETAAEAVSTD